MYTAESFGISCRGEPPPENEERFLTATFGRWAHVAQSNVTTNAGRLREVLTAGQGHLIMVADGMGGHAHGTLASQVVLDSLFSHIVTRSDWAAHPAIAADRVLEDLRRAIEHAQRRLAWVALRKGLAAAQVGTTALVGVIAWPLLLLAHVGDSRCYLHRSGRVRCVTREQTLGQEARARGEPETSARRYDHVLTSAILNTAAPKQVELSQVSLQEGDVILLCTDGFAQALGPGDMARAISPSDTAQGMCESLVAAANLCSRDNATLLATKIVRV